MIFVCGMLTKDGLFSQEAEAAAEAEALHRHFQRSAEFLRQIFAPMVAGLDDEQIREVVALAHERGKEAGANSSRLQLQYLVMVASWGSYFDTDPQYWAILNKAGWPETYPAAPQKLGVVLADLAEGIDAFEAAVADDRTEAARILWAFEDVGDHDWSQADSSVLHHAVRHVWPARTRWLGPELVKYCCDAMIDQLAQWDLSRAEIALVTCMSFQLGHGLCHDPLFPWIRESLQLSRSEARRRTLTEGLRDSYQRRIAAVRLEDEQ